MKKNVEGRLRPATESDISRQRRQPNVARGFAALAPGDLGESNGVGAVNLMRRRRWRQRMGEHAPCRNSFVPGLNRRPVVANSQPLLNRSIYTSWRLT